MLVIPEQDTIVVSSSVYCQYHQVDERSARHRLVFCNADFQATVQCIPEGTWDIRCLMMLISIFPCSAKNWPEACGNIRVSCWLCCFRPLLNFVGIGGTSFFGITELLELAYFWAEDQQQLQKFNEQKTNFLAHHQVQVIHSTANPPEWDTIGQGWPPVKHKHTNPRSNRSNT